MKKRSGQRIPAGRGLLAGLLLAAAWWCAGCGLLAGYAPEEVPVHRGRAAAVQSVVPDSLRVVSWNIQYGEAVETALEELQAHPRLADPDLLLVQELDPAGAALLADSLGLDYVYRPASVHPHHARLFGNAVLSRWPIVDHGLEILPHPSPGSGHRRIAVSATVDLGARGELVAVSVHTATVIMEPDKRLAQAAAVFDSLGLDDRPAVVAGDFNTVSDYDATLLRRMGRKLGFEYVRLPAGPTVESGLGKLSGQQLVLDHILVRGLAPGARGVVRSTTASDHYPVWAVVALPPKEE